MSSDESQTLIEDGLIDSMGLMPIVFFLEPPLVRCAS